VRSDVEPSCCERLTFVKGVGSGRRAFGLDMRSEAAPGRRVVRRSCPTLRFLALIATACALVGPTGGQALALATGQTSLGAGHSARGSRQSTARSHHPFPAGRHPPHRHFHEFKGSTGYGAHPAYAYPLATEYDPYFSDPSSTGYIPYCDPGSLYFDPPSCEEMTQ